MTVAATTPLAKGVSVEDARTELSRFFQVADLATKAPEMFSQFIDAEWHRLLNGGDYSAFCMMSVGHPVGHVEERGQGTPSWLDIYHERFGTLPAVWFAAAEGIVDMAAYESYLDIRSINASSPCTAAPPPCTVGDPPALITAWDCTPTTGDPDFARTQPDTPIPPVPDEFPV